MSMYLQVDGNLYPFPEKKEELKQILTEKFWFSDCNIAETADCLTFDFADDVRYSYPDSLVDAILPLVKSGTLDFHNQDDDSYYRCSIKDGKAKYHDGTILVCYDDFEDEFANELSDKVVDAVVRRSKAMKDAQ